MTVCGTGGWTGPVPGDPDNAVTIAAVQVFGGINVSWTYPGTNPHAVAHTILYRGTTANFAASIQRSVVAGNQFFDALNVDQTFYYWIRIISVNGTVGDLIGPASAVAKKRVTDLIDDLTNEIDEGVLATALRTEIANITLNYNQLQSAIYDRIQGDAALAAAIALVQSGVEEAVAFISTEITTRTNGDSAMISQINTQAALNAANLALIQSETLTRVGADEALASELTTIAALTTTNASAILSTNIALASATGAQASTNTSLYAAAAAAQGSADAAAAAVVTEQSARVAADAALATSVTTVQSTMQGNLVSAQTTLQTNINTVNGKVNEIGALYTMKLSVNGLIGGFGVYNNGVEVEAGFDVTRFWIGQTVNGVRAYPFIVDNGVVYMDTVRIKDLTVGGNKIIPGACSWVEMQQTEGTAVGCVVVIPPFVDGVAQIVALEIMVANQQVITDFGGETGNATYNFGTLKAYTMIDGVPQLVTPTPFDFGTGPHLIRGSDVAPGTYQIVATRANWALGYNPPPMKLLVKMFKK